MGSIYKASFFDRQKHDSYASAKVVVPYVLSLISPKSIVDFGSGVGTWLRACRESGIEDIIGVDGEYVCDELLAIPKSRFVRADLTKPLNLGRRFDLVISLEVAEHLPKEQAHTFIETLTRHGEIVLFSAAIPLQGGSYHVNEQWPQYWNSLFGTQGYACVDCLRQVFWEDNRIAWWYRQNMFIFVASDLLNLSPSLFSESVASKGLPLSLVHPDFIRSLISERIGLGELFRNIPSAMRRSLFR